MSETLTPPVTPPAADSRPAKPRRNWLKIVATAVLLVVLLLLPVLIGTEVAYLKLAQYILIGAVGGIGLTLLVGQAGQLSLAHPFFLLVGSGELRGAVRRPRGVPRPRRARAAAAAGA